MLRTLVWFMVSLLVFSLAAAAQELDDAGFVPIFTGHDLTGWHAIGQQDWHADDGVLWTEGKGGWLSSDQPFADFALRLEYRLTKGAVSGIFLRSAEQGDPTFTGLRFSHGPGTGAHKEDTGSSTSQPGRTGRFGLQTAFQPLPLAFSNEGMTQPVDQPVGTPGSAEPARRECGPTQGTPGRSAWQECPRHENY